MSDLESVIASFMICAVSFLGSGYPLIGRFLVQSRYSNGVFVSATVLFVFALVGAFSYDMTPRLGFFVAAGVAPLHQLLLLRHLYRRFTLENGRSPQLISRRAPQADRTFAVTNIMVGVVPYAVVAMYFAKFGR